ncbi:uncharacterized protein LOC143007603 [Genypterus blacodes]|uniref:uncharacterized protein LOC143007603 n=1 Tax=Genypterus blacodes TaxID=154954 RepID=UPI003F763975
MSSTLLLKAFVNERLTAAAEEIFQVFEKTIIKYEAEVSGCQQEIQRLRGLLLHHTTDSPQPLICKEEPSPEHQHCEQDLSPNLSLSVTEPRSIKEEETEQWEDYQYFKQANVLYRPSSSDWRQNQQEDPEASLPPPAQNNVPNSDWEEQLQELQGTKAVQFRLHHHDTSEPEDPESERPAAGLSDCQHALREESQIPLLTPRASIDSSDVNTLTSSQRCYLCDINVSQHLSNHVCPLLPNDVGVACRVCGKAFESPDALSVHMKTHKGSSSCHVCGKQCKGITALTNHMVSHSGIKLHRCHVCGKECGRKGDLKIHMRIHTGEKPFCCSYCQMRFTHSGHLKKHMRSHTGERPHRCDVCSRRFLQSVHLKCHLRTHAQKY